MPDYWRAVPWTRMAAAELTTMQSISWIENIRIFCDIILWCLIDVYYTVNTL